MPVFDFSNFGQAIVQVSMLWDQVNSTMEQVKNSYEQIQQQVAMVKQLDFSELDLSLFEPGSVINFDNPQESVKALIDQSKNMLKDVENTLSSKRMNFAGQEYSLGGLLGLGGAGSGKGLFDLTAGIADHIKETGKSVAEKYKKSLSPKQLEAIKRRYGMSTENYVSMQMVGKVVEDSLKEMFITGSGEHAASLMKQVGDKTGAVGELVKGAGESLVSQVQSTTAAIGNVVAGIENLESSMNRLGSFMAQQEIVRRAREEIEAEAREQTARTEAAVKESLTKKPAGY
jgi:hypothetical protein